MKSQIKVLMSIHIKELKINFRKFFFKQKVSLLNSDLIIAKRVLIAGIINTIIGPSILLILIYLSNDLVRSYFIMQFFMFFFKGFIYKKIVFKDIRSKKSYLIPFFLVISGSIYAGLIQGLNLPQIYKAIILLVVLTLSNSFIAIFGSRFIKGKE